MDIAQTITNTINVINPYLTKELLMSVWNVARYVLIGIVLFIIYGKISKFNLFRRVKKIVKLLIEINDKLSIIITLTDTEEREREIVRKFKKKNGL